MASYQGVARTNYFRVKDEAAFREAMAELPDVRVVETRSPDSSPHFALIVNGDGGGWVLQEYDFETGKDREFDVPALLAPHLADDSIAILMHVGFEGSRSLDGHAIAVDSTGEIEEISLADIFDRAAQTLKGTAQNAWG